MPFMNNNNYFLTIVKAGSLNRAAEMLYVSQPSLSKYIQRLESSLGTALFDRTVSPMRLNDAGRLYYEYLVEQSARKEELLVQIAQVNHMDRGTLRLGIPSYCGQCYLPWVLKEFTARYPSVSLELFESSGDVIERAVAEQEIDLGILHLPISNSNLSYQELFSEHVLMAVPKTDGDQSQGDGGKIDILNGSIREFSDCCFIIPHAEQKLGQIVTDLFCRADFTPRIRFRSQNVTTSLAMTALGLGASFLPTGGLSALPRSILNKVTFYRLKELDHDDWKLIALQRKGYRTPNYTNQFIELISRYGQISNQTDRSWMVIDML